jgi:hypothetical protein
MKQTSPETETERRKERVSMAKEICSYRGENPNSVDRGGNEGWEKYEPLAGACIREAERLFAIRKSGLAPRPAVSRDQLIKLIRSKARVAGHDAWEGGYYYLANADEIADAIITLSDTSTVRQNIVAIEPNPENIEPSPEPLD